MTTIDFDTYRRAYQIPKDTISDIPLTNNRIGDEKLKIYGARYSVPELEYPGFLKKYVRDVVEAGEIEYMTEHQLVSDSPILVDLDLHYSYETTERQYTEEHLVDLIGAFVEELTKAFQFDEGSSYSIYVQEKPEVNRVQKHNKNITKDGIHLVIGINAERRMQILLREKMIVRLRELWKDLPIVNTWEEVFDEVISNGQSGWQLYGSAKPGFKPYQLTRIYTIGYDPNDGQPIINWRSKGDPGWAPDWQELVPKMSARCRDHPRFFYRREFERELSNIVVSRRKEKTGTLATGGADKEMSKFTKATLNARSVEELNRILDEFIDDNREQGQWKWNELVFHTMALPEKYYDPRNTWISVGMALKHTADALFIVWMAFSAKSSKFDLDDMDKHFNTWNSFESRENGLTAKSIIYWCKADAPKQYSKVRIKCAEETLNRVVGGYEEIDEEVKIDRKGTNDYDLACVLFALKGDEFKCANSTSKTWYRFDKHRWKKSDGGLELRSTISLEMRELYMKRAMEYMALRDGLPDDEDPRKVKKITKYCDKLLDVCRRLGTTSDKNNIMTEAKELFHDPLFMEKLDTNEYLLCFNNGVYDFRNNEFRRGAPDDYLTKCTNIDYVEFDREKQRLIVEEIEDFMRKLFPKPELCEYMWNHLASTMTGLVKFSQTFNIYIGGGQNGKSVLIKLMDSVLGEYKGVMPVNMLTDRRGKVGSASPEIMGLKGVRMAVAQEPQKGERLNEGVVKEYSSGEDVIQGRALYSGDMVSFLPQFQLVICTNYLPEIAGNDHGIWRRVRVVPFESLFTDNPVDDDPEKPYQFKIDRKISQRMDTWKEVFASMLVERAKVNQGMVKDCEVVIAASDAYRQSQDCIAEFIGERVILDASGTITQTELNAEFKSWYENSYGRKTGPNIKEVRAVMDKKFTKFGKVWRGARISYESDMNGTIDEDDVSDPNALY